MGERDAEGRATVFGTVAEDYARLRPAPCAAAVDWLLPEGCARVLDLAAGAGTLTVLLAERVPDVVAVEPDDRMRAVLSARNPGVTALKGTAEEIPLPDGGLDAVVVSSAWHWFDTTRAIPEITRVLRPGGRLSVVWNGLDGQVPWVTQWRKEFLPGRAAQQRPRERDTVRAEYLWRGERLREALAETPGSLFGDIEEDSFTCTHRATAGDTAALLGTYSRIIVLPDDERRRLLARAERTLCALHGLHGAGDELDLPFRSGCWRATRSRDMAQN